MPRSPLVLLAALVLASVPACLAQQGAPSTWHGLTFGDSIDSVRTTLNNQQIPTELSQNGSLQSTQDYALFLPGLPSTLPMLSSYHFTPNGGLMDVTLALDLPALRRSWPDATGSDDSLAAFAGERLAGALAGRYGAPLYRSAGCETTSPATGPSTPECIVFWSGPQQTVVLERRHTAHGEHLIVRYQMLATDL
ncbi:MAG: hypothetical protein PW735_07660 [Acidobacteriaceae bacterium]|nr:hypothetical protein [Acidobacteriaceae bacterium]